MLVLAEMADIKLSRPEPFTADDRLTDLQVPAPPPGDEEAWTAALRQKSRELARFMAH